MKPIGKHEQTNMRWNVTWDNYIETTNIFKRFLNSEEQSYSLQGKVFPSHHSKYFSFKRLITMIISKLASTKKNILSKYSFTYYRHLCWVKLFYLLFVFMCWQEHLTFKDNNEYKNEDSKLSWLKIIKRVVSLLKL